MEIVALIPAALAAWLALKSTPQRAFLGVYIPVLLLLPDYYRFMPPGLPDPTFSQAVAVAIFLVFLFRSTERWRFSLMDFQVLAFASTIGLSEFLAAGYKEAQNLLFDMVAWVLLPYLLAKALISTRDSGQELAKRMVICISLVLAPALFEALTGINLFRLVLDRFFPWQGLGWVTTYRYGFWRAAGPYAHAILCGVIFALALTLNRWLVRSGAWPERFRALRRLPISAPRLVTWTLIAGLVLSLSRGPWLGAILALTTMSIGLARNRRRAIAWAAVVVLLIGLPLVVRFVAYASVGREAAQTATQETAAYRKELIDRYVDIALDHSLLGWGRNTWPKLPGAPSIDNHYLLLALMHGVVAVLLLISIFVSAMSRLAMRAKLAGHSEEGALAVTLFATYVAVGFAIATVFMGVQLLPLFFLITGWSERFLLDRQSSVAQNEWPASVAESLYPSWRILA